MIIIKTLRKIFYIALAIFFILIGTAGLILPVLNGVLFLIIGLIILSFEFGGLEAFLFRVTKRHPKLHYWYVKLDALLRKYLRK